MEKQLDAKKIMLQNGILLGLVTILISVIGYVSGITLSGDSILQLLISVLGFAAIIVFIVLGIKKYRAGNGGFISLSQAIKIGLGVAVIGGVIAALYNVVFVEYIDPDFTEKILLLQKEKMLEADPNLTQQQLDAGIGMARKFSTPWMQFAFSIIGSLFFGFIITLIAGLVMRKEEPQV